MIFLDNAWAHHSRSLEQLASNIGCGDRYPDMTIVLRPPYKGRYGALIERFFKNLSGRIKEELAGSIASSDRKAVRNAAKAACLLYEDIDRYLQGEIVRYHAREHSELNMSPNDKWIEGMAGALPLVPPREPAVERLFWPRSHDTRQKGSQGVSVNGFHYWSMDIGKIPEFGSDGKKAQYTYALDPDDVGAIALFRASDGAYMCDGEARELRQADNSLRRMSQAEIEMTRWLAPTSKQAAKDLLVHVNETKARNKTRQTEAAAARRTAGRGTSRTSKGTRVGAGRTVKRTSTRSDTPLSHDLDPASLMTPTEYDLLTTRLSEFVGKPSAN